MRLYVQTILIIAVTVFAVAAILFVTFEYTVMGSLSALEQEYASEDLHRAENSIAGEATRLSEISRDWGVWDDTYQYMGNRDPGYLTSNFVPSSLKGMNINLIALYDGNGSLVSGITTGQNASDTCVIPESIAHILSTYPSLMVPSQENSGIILDNGNPLILASHEIVTSHMKGPSRGTIVIASLLDDRKINEFSRNILQNITITQVSDSPASGSLTQFGMNGSVYQQISSDQSIILDISGKPALILQIHEPRDLSRNGIYSRIFLILSLLLMSVLFMGLASWLLNRIIILPLQSLNRDLLAIGSSGSLSGRIQINRNDEIGDLASSINTMIGSLEETQQERISTEHRLARLVELVEEGICLIGPDNLIWFANPAFTTIFEITSHQLIGMCLQDILITRDHEHQDEKICPLSIGSGHHEFHTVTGGGRDIWVRVTLAPYPLETGRIGQLCVVTNISKYRTAERELLLSNKKLSLLGSMTRHDIVNQLTTIRGMVGLIKMKNTDHMLDQLIAGAEDASEKINKHIEFSKEYQKAGIEEPRWQDLRTVWNLAYAMARKKGLTFTVTGDNYEIYADQLLQKVFFNLIENSLKHGKNVFYLTVTMKCESSHLSIIYEDDGGGIPDSMKDRIFDRGVGSGTGWGLFFAREVLDLTSMSISESGIYGIGARFIITAPEGIFRTSTGTGMNKEQNSS